MNPFDMDNERIGNERIYGVVVGEVAESECDKLGRVKLHFKFLPPEFESNWAAPAALMAGSKIGTFFKPDKGDKVLVAFEFGDFNKPYIIGGLYHKDAEPPVENHTKENNIRMIKSRSGHILRFDDTKDNGKLEIIDQTGKNQIVIDSKENTITIKSDKEIILEAPNGTIKFQAKNIELQSTENIAISSKQNTDIKAKGNTTIKGKTVNIN